MLKLYFFSLSCSKLNTEATDSDKNIREIKAGIFLKPEGCYILKY